MLKIANADIHGHFMTAEYKEHSQCCRTLYLLTNLWTLVGKSVSSNQGRIYYTKLDQKSSVSLEISVMCKVKSRKYLSNLSVGYILIT